MRPTMKHLLAIMTLLGSAAAAGASDVEVMVIANPSVKFSAVSPEELRGIFLVTRTSLADGSHVEPVVLTSGAVHQLFVRRFVGKSGAALETYYRSMVFTGRGLMPKAFGSDADVVNYVAKTRGAIGYVSTTASLAGVKTLEVK
jgi:hypothetical protein